MTKKEYKFTLTCAPEFMSSANPNLFSFVVLKNKNCYNCGKNNKPLSYSLIEVLRIE